MIKKYPVSEKEYSKKDAPFIYTQKAEEFAKLRPRLEPRTAGTIACFGGEPLQHGITARAWIKAGYVVER